MNCTKRFISLVLILAALTGTLVLTTNASDSVKSAIGIVDASALRLRAEPSTSSEIRGLAYRDDFVVILEAQGDWYKVIYNLKEGYMHSGLPDCERAGKCGAGLRPGECLLREYAQQAHHPPAAW